MRELETGGASPAVVFEEGSRSRDRPTERSSARNWRRVEYAPARAREHAPRRADEGRARRAETAWREVVWLWLRRLATATASSSARAASEVKHCLAALTGVGIAGKHIYICMYV